MQFSKGAGLKELISMSEFEKRDFYSIWRPFYLTSRDEILEYLKKNNLKYFYDKSNDDLKYKRNFFRHKFSNEFVKLFSEGVKKSFVYLEEDKNLLIKENWQNIKKLYFFKKEDPKIDIKKVDLIAKKLGILLTKSQKDEIIRQNFSSVIQGKLAIDSNNEKIFIAPYIKTKLDKEFKEKMRIKKIPPKVRGYIFKENLKV